MLDGSFQGEAQKVAILAHLPCVIAARGAAMFPSSAAVNINGRFKTFDDLLPQIPSLFKQICDQFEAHTLELGVFDITTRGGEFVIAGFSHQRNALEAYAMVSHDKYGNCLLKPWRLHSIQGLSFSPSNDQALAEFRKIIDQMDNVLEEPEVASLRFMKVQRNMSEELADGFSLVGAGVFAQLTTLTRDGINTRILERWAPGGGRRPRSRSNGEDGGGIQPGARLASRAEPWGSWGSTAAPTSADRNRVGFAGVAKAQCL